MKKIFIALCAVILSLTANAQGEVAGVPFGASKAKAANILVEKYGMYDYCPDGLIMYDGFTLDGVTYKTAAFHFDSNLKFTSASFSMPTHGLQETDKASKDMTELINKLEATHTVVNLVEYGYSQTKTIGNTTVSTLYRAVPKNTPIVDGKAAPPYFINIIVYASPDGIRVMANYSEML